MTSGSERLDSLHNINVKIGTSKYNNEDIEFKEQQFIYNKRQYISEKPSP